MRLLFIVLFSPRREKSTKRVAAQGKNPRFFPWVTLFLNVRGAAHFCAAPDCAAGRRSTSLPQARHNRTALAVSYPISPWVIGFIHRKIYPWVSPPWLSRDGARDALRGCTETFSDTRSPWQERGRASLRPRPSHNFMGDFTRNQECRRSATLRAHCVDRGLGERPKGSFPKRISLGVFLVS